MPDDENLTELDKLAEKYWRAEHRAKAIRRDLDNHIQNLKRAGYPFRELSRRSGLAQGTIQSIVAKDGK